MGRYTRVQGNTLHCYGSIFSEHAEIASLLGMDDDHQLALHNCGLESINCKCQIFHTFSQQLIVIPEKALRKSQEWLVDGTGTCNEEEEWDFLNLRARMGICAVLVACRSKACDFGHTEARELSCIVFMLFISKHI